RPQTPVRALVPLFPAPTTADLPDDAASVSASSLIIAATDDVDSMTGNAVVLAQALGGAVVLRTLPGANAQDILERPTLKSVIGFSGAERKIHAAVRAQLTGFLLTTLTDDAAYADFADPAVSMTPTLAVDVASARRADADHFSQLLGNAPYKPEEGTSSKGLRALGR
ncbi:MAG: alpha/beta hydrolase, partial [Gordonia sp. (in: high G+C Gram-positive bacteria)]